MDAGGDRGQGPAEVPNEEQLAERKTDLSTRTDRPRHQACAGGGRALASKTLIERLEDDDAAGLGIDPDRMTYSILGELATASERPGEMHRPSRCGNSER